MAEPPAESSELVSENDRARSSNTRSSVTFHTHHDSPVKRPSTPLRRISAGGIARPVANLQGPQRAQSSSSGLGFSPPKRVNSLSMNMEVANGEPSRGTHTQKRSDATKKKHRSKRTSTRRDVRTMDYGLGLLDDPSYLG